jgi:hypothetical protein
MIGHYDKIINYTMSLIFIIIPAIQVKYMPKYNFKNIINFLGKPIRYIDSYRYKSL